MLREFENVFLDGMTVDELRKAGKETSKSSKRAEFRSSRL